MADNEDGDVPIEDEPTYNRNKIEDEDDLDAKFPNRPRNRKPTLYFHTLCQDLLGPLHKLAVRGPAARAAIPAKQVVKRKGPYQQRSEIIERFIQHWRHDVGKDLYPAFRLILPDKDNDRQVYGLKESALGRLLVRILGLDAKRSEDARNLINWKAPTGGFSPAGDFPGLCYNALKARSMLTDPGNMRVGEVNELLDQLSICSKREEYLPLLKEFYRRMNAEEMTWLIRIILKQMKIGTGHEVFLRFMHAGAPSKWSSTSSLRTVCWTLYDETCVWDGEVTVKPFDCFQPQLCKQVNQDFEKTVERMDGTPEDPEFWVQEKLDGERIQMHMANDPETGERRFMWYSRNGTDYTYLYGSSYDDPTASVTRYLKAAFPSNIENIILDGEMIGWDPLTKGMIPFGTLKGIALHQGAHPENTSGARPVFKIFDCLYCNNRDVTKYTLRDRRNLLEQAIQEVPGRMEFLAYWKCNKAEQIEEKLRQVIAEASEGLVVKNPRSAYTLTVSSRSDAWVKIKPDYMNELGEHLDCVIIGANFGSGSRGGGHSSFLCGLRCVEDPNNPPSGINPQKCWSFVNVGGGYSVEDYKAIHEKTQGKWQRWDRNNPPNEYIELAGDHLQYERPDEWIKPEDSVVIAVKATQVSSSDRFRTGVTLRFPRFKEWKQDRNWKSALSMAAFVELKMEVEKQQTEKKLEIDRERQLKRRKITASRKKTFTVIGASNDTSTTDKGKGVPTRGCFAGIEFCVMTDMDRPLSQGGRLSKTQIEKLIAANGGVYWASPDKRGPNIICVADKKPTNVYALMKKGTHNIVRPTWLLDCIKQYEKDYANETMCTQPYLLPLETGRHLFFSKNAELNATVEAHTDEFGDPYARDLDIVELKELLENMPDPQYPVVVMQKSLNDILEQENINPPELKTSIFRGKDIYFYTGSEINDIEHNRDVMDVDSAPTLDKHERGQNEDISTFVSRQYALFGGAVVSSDWALDQTTHVVICPDRGTDMTPKDLAAQVRAQISSSWRRGVALPRLVSREWINECWNEGTLVDEERFTV